MSHALIVEDDPNSLSGLSAIVAADGFTVDTATTFAEARAALSRFVPDVVLIDLNLPDGSGLDLLQSLPARPDGVPPVIVMTGNATVESAIEGLRHGIWDYLLKPINIVRLRSLLSRIPRPHELAKEVQTLRGMLRRLGRFGPMIGRSSAMQQVYDSIEHCALAETPVLIYGEAGTGKHMVAHTLHQMSRRRNGPFVVCDCRALMGAGAERSINSALFGEEPGAGASGAARSVSIAAERRMPGYFEQAVGGTLFIDEIVALPSAQQQALLRVLDAQTFMRTGGTRPVGIDCRLMIAMSEPPQNAVAHGRLREDLWRGLQAASIAVPALREREEDGVLIAEALIDALNRQANASGFVSAKKRMGLNFIRECVSYEWPGNVRELRERVERAYHVSGDIIDTLMVNEIDMADGQRVNGGSVQVIVGTPLSDVEDLLIRATLDAVGGTRHRAATLLGISPKTLYNKLQRMKLS